MGATTAKQPRTNEIKRPKYIIRRWLKRRFFKEAFHAMTIIQRIEFYGYENPISSEIKNITSLKSITRYERRV
jgi:hypothetical protein